MTLFVIVVTPDHKQSEALCHESWSPEEDRMRHRLVKDSLLFVSGCAERAEQKAKDGYLP